MIHHFEVVVYEKNNENQYCLSVDAVHFYEQPERLGAPKTAG